LFTLIAFEQDRPGNLWHGLNDRWRYWNLWILRRSLDGLLHQSHVFASVSRIGQEFGFFHVSTISFAITLAFELSIFSETSST